MTTYTRHVEGRTETMVEVAPNEAINMVAALRLGLIANPRKT